MEKDELTRRDFVTTVAAGIVAAALSYVGHNNLLDCFTDDPTPSQCDRVGLGGNSHKTRLRRILDAHSAQLAQHPIWASWISAHKSDPKSSFKQLPAKGIRRLAADRLTEWNRLRLVLATASPDVCEQLWTGGVSENALFNALAAIPESDAIGWFALSREAGALEIQQSRLPEIDDDAIADGIKVIASELKNQHERERYSTLIVRGENLRGPEACEALKGTLTGAITMPPPLRERFLRALSAI